MKRTIYILALTTVALLSSLTSWAVVTTDRLALSDVVLNPGDGVKTNYMTLSVVSVTRIYAAFNVDIYLPEGVEPVLGNTGTPRVTKTGILPKDEFDEDYLHTLSATYSKDENKLRLICYANPSADFTSMSGALCRIYVTATTYAKPGKLSVSLTEQNLTTKDNTKYEPADVAYDNITISTQATAKLNISADNQWSTAILPFGVTEMPDGLKAYACDSKDETEKVFYLTKATTIQPYTPYILYSESGYTGTMTGEVDATQYPEDGYVKVGYLTGAIVKQTTNEGYMLQKQDDKVKFYLADPSKTYTILPGKCWATPDGSSADSYDFKFAPTAVDNVKASDSNVVQTVICDLTGKVITQPQNGQMYITKGKKFVK